MKKALVMIVAALLCLATLGTALADRMYVLPDSDKRHLTSVKNGCAEGACGTCTVLIDGYAKKACVYKLSRLEGAKIVTLEGLSEREKNIYGYAFAKCGAVQCGFCIPGMVMCAKGLIDRNPAPTPQEVKKAIRGNLCRCTGYEGQLRGIRSYLASRRK